VGDEGLIGNIAYDFDHEKTYEGLVRLFLENIDVACVLAAPRVDLPFYQSKIRIAPKGIGYPHPRQVAKRLGVPYYVVQHNIEECVSIIREHELTLGIVYGARILKKAIVRLFDVGILNAHPGLLPYNRGPDNIKWAILDNIPQGVCCHLIDEKIDWGSIIFQQIVDVYEDDTLIDVHLRVKSVEQSLMVKAIGALESGYRPSRTQREGRYHKAVPGDLEAKLRTRFCEYKRNYAAIVERWQRDSDC